MVFEELRPRMFGLAYRMLGSAQGADDIVQEAYLRWSAASGVQSPQAWLIKVVTNLCLNELASARARRETYVGPWLPEPVLTEPDVAHTAELRESVSMAMLTLLERLTPAERAVFVLKEAFGYRHAEIADILGLSEAAARQLLSRARKHVGSAPRFEAGRAEQRRLVERFLAAAQHGDVVGLTTLLAEQAVAVSDGGGKVSAALHPVVGRDRVMRFILGIMQRTASAMLFVREISGSPAIVASIGADVIAVAVFDVADGLVNTVSMVRNPEKLAFLANQLSRS